MPADIQPSSGADLDSQHLIAGLKQALQATIFTSSLRVQPRRLNQIAHDTRASFEQFLAKEDVPAAQAYGQHLVREGLSYRTVLALCEAVRSACWESSNPEVRLMPVSGRYVGALLEGYMQEREAHILREQERTRQALERAKDQKP